MVRARRAVEAPHIVAVLDSSLFRLIDVTRGLREGGVLVVNSKGIGEGWGRGFRVAWVDATGIALEEGLTLAGVPLVNVAMVGAVARVSGLIRLGSLREAVFRRWRGELAERNWRCVRRGFEEVEVCLGR